MLSSATQRRGPAAGAHPLGWVAEDRLASGFVLLGLGAGSRSLQSPRSLPERAARSGEPQRPLRQGAVGLGGAAPSPEPWLPPPAARSLPSPQPAGGRRTGGPGTWAPPSHPHSHTHPRRTRAPSPAETQALARPSAAVRRAATLPPSPGSRPWQAAASPQTAPSRPPSEPPGPDPRAAATPVRRGPAAGAGGHATGNDSPRPPRARVRRGEAHPQAPRGPGRRAREPNRGLDPGKDSGCVPRWGPGGRRRKAGLRGRPSVWASRTRAPQGVGGRERRRVGGSAGVGTCRHPLSLLAVGTARGIPGRPAVSESRVGRLKGGVRLGRVREESWEGRRSEALLGFRPSWKPVLLRVGGGTGRGTVSFPIRFWLLLQVLGATTAGGVFHVTPNPLLPEASCDKCFYRGPLSAPGTWLPEKALPAGPCASRNLEEWRRGWCCRDFKETL